MLCDYNSSKRFNRSFHTSREPIPDLQPVVATEHTSRGRWVWLQLEAFKLQDDLWHLRGEDHKCAVQIVGVFLGVAWRLYDATVGGEVPGAFRTCGERMKGKRKKWENEMRPGQWEGAGLILLTDGLLNVLLVGWLFVVGIEKLCLPVSLLSEGEFIAHRWETTFIVLFNWRLHLVLCLFFSFPYGHKCPTPSLSVCVCV